MRVGTRSLELACNESAGNAGKTGPSLVLRARRGANPIAAGTAESRIAATMECMNGVPAFKRSPVRLICRVTGLACLSSLVLLAMGNLVGLPADVGPVLLMLAVASAFHFALFKWVGVFTKEFDLLEALFFSALFVVAICASLFTAVVYNHRPRTSDRLAVVEVSRMELALRMTSSRNASLANASG